MAFIAYKKEVVYSVEYTAFFFFTMINLLSEDRELIIYRKSLRNICSSVNSSILFSQLIYWFKKNDFKPFYKFIRPCSNDKYIDGDSWIEELGFSYDEFTTAFNNIGIKYKTKTEFYEKFGSENKMFYSYSDKQNGLTYWIANKKLIEENLNNLYEKQDEIKEKNDTPRFTVNRDSRFTEVGIPDLLNITENTTEKKLTKEENQISNSSTQFTEDKNLNFSGNSLDIVENHKSFKKNNYDLKKLLKDYLKSIKLKSSYLEIEIINKFYSNLNISFNELEVIFNEFSSKLSYQINSFNIISNLTILYQELSNDLPKQNNSKDEKKSTPKHKTILRTSDNTLQPNHTDILLNHISSILSSVNYENKENTLYHLGEIAMLFPKHDLRFLNKIQILLSLNNSSDVCEKCIYAVIYYLLNTRSFIPFTAFESVESLNKLVENIPIKDFKNESFIRKFTSKWDNWFSISIIKNINLIKEKYNKSKNKRMSKEDFYDEYILSFKENKGNHSNFDDLDRHFFNYLNKRI